MVVFEKIIIRQRELVAYISASHFNIYFLDLISLTCPLTFYWKFFYGAQDWKFEKKSSDIYVPDNISDNERSSGGNGSASDMNIDEEAPLIPSSRLSHIGRTQLTNHPTGK